MKLKVFFKHEIGMIYLKANRFVKMQHFFFNATLKTFSAMIEIMILNCELIERIQNSIIQT